MSILEIMTDRLDECVDVDLYQPSDELLDDIWTHLYTNNNDGLIMSDAINGDEEVERLQVELARFNLLQTAQALRERLQALFRNYAYKQAECFEFDVMQAVRENAAAKVEYRGDEI